MGNLSGGTDARDTIGCITNRVKTNQKGQTRFHQVKRKAAIEDDRKTKDDMKVKDSGHPRHAGKAKVASGQKKATLSG